MPRIVDHEAVRKDLLERCIGLFADQGFAGLTMRRLARALEVSTGTLYHYFPSKEAVFEGVVQTVVTREFETTVAGLLSQLDDPVAVLLDYVEAHETRLIQQILVLIEHLRSQTVDAAPEPIRGAMLTYHGRFFDTLGVVLGIDDPRAAQAIVLFLRGLLLQRFLDGGTTPLRAHEPTLRALVAS
jgi:AcrR family transcriptional regulator